LGKFYPVIGGVDKVMFDIALSSKIFNIECDVLCASHTSAKSEILVDNCKIFCTSSYAKIAATMISPGMVTKLRAISGGYDIIHIHHPDPMAALALFFSNFKGKVVLHWHSDIIKQKLALKLFEPLQNWLLKRADCIIATSFSYAEGSIYLKKYSEKVAIVPIGINPNDLIVDEELVKRIKLRFKNKHIVYSLGRLCYYKGFEYLIDAANFLDDSYVIVIAGGGDLKDKLEQLIVDKGLDDKVYLVGKISDSEKGGYYAAADIFCLSSVERSEAFGIVQIEAMSFGKPVVATNIPLSGVNWVNQDGISGINVPIRDSKALATAFQRIITDENLYQKLSLGAKGRFLDNFEFDIMMDKVKTIYEEVLSSGYSKS